MRSETKMIRVLLVDDQALFREGLSTVLSTFDDLQIVGEAADGEAAVVEAERLCPDVVLMDLRMPRVDGVEAIRRLRARGPSPPVLALTTFDDDESVFEAVRAGAIGYVLKDTSAAQVVEAIRAAARGESFLQPRVATKLVTAFAQLSTAPSSATERHGLSQRELDVVRGIARGESNKEIAVALGVAEGTVKNHVTNVLAKLGVTDRTQAALKARELGLA
jgi:DNA-binding NarL/FixJ family response regulator